MDQESINFTENQIPNTSPNPSQIKPHRYRKYLILGVVLFITISIGSILYALENKEVKMTEPVAQNVVTSPTVTPTSGNLSNRRFHKIFRLANNKITPVTSVEVFGNGAYGDIEPTYDETTKTIYFTDINTITAYSLLTNSSQVYYRNTKPDTIISSVDLTSLPVLYITLAPTEIDDFNNIQLTLLEYNIKTNQTREIPSIKPVRYGNVSYLFKSGNKDIIGTFGGDGCGGYGEIYAVDSTSKKLLQKTGGGCVRDPNYFGNIKSQNALLMASILPESGEDELGEILYNELYLINVDTLEKTTLLDLKPYSSYRMRFNEKNNTLSLESNKEIVTFNIETQKLETLPQKSKNIPESHTSYETNTMLYAAEYNKDEFYIIDRETGEQTTISWKGVFEEVGDSPGFLGKYDSDILFYAITYE